MKLGVLMDPPHTLNYHKDTTIAFFSSAQRMGWDCFFFTQDSLVCRGEDVFADVSRITINDLCQADWASIDAVGDTALSSFDIILVRQDPPVDIEYIHSTYALELAEKSGVVVSNKPSSLRDVSEKSFILHFPQCTPTTIVSCNMKALRSFWEKHQSVIFKPLNGMGGHGIFHVGDDGQNLSVILETLTNHQRTTIMAQCYVPGIHVQGDKRVLLINGEPVPYAFARFPAKGETRGNLAAGAQGKVVPLTDRDRWICHELKATLQAKQLGFVGIDIIGDYLTEINVTSPTCLRQIASETGIDIAEQYLMHLATRVSR